MSESEYSPAASPDVALRELGVRASELRDAVRKAAATGADRELVLRFRAIVLELDRLIETLATFASGGSQPDTQVLVHDLLQLTRNAVGLEPAKDVGELETLVRQLGAAVQRYSRAEPATKKTAKAWGTIKWFNARKGFGFITPDGGGEDLFIHTSSISSPGFRVLKEGDRVQFEVTQGPKSKRGSNIQAMDSGNVSPRLEKDKRSKGKRFGTEVEAAKKKGPQGNEQPRWILAQVFDLSAGEPKKPTRAIHAGARHEIHVIIGAAQKDWLVAQGRNAAQSIDSMLSEGTHELTVVFFMPNLGTRTGKLTLPSSGPTPKPAIFRFRAGSAGSLIEALISIVHRGRVLQTALLSGRAVADPLRAQKNARITLRLQVVVPGFADLNARESFDAALVTASTANKRAVAAGVVHAATGSDKTVYFNQPRIEGAARNIRDLRRSGDRLQLEQPRRAQREGGAIA